MGNWNKNDWQGKRKEQVEFSSKMGFYSLVAGSVILFILFLLKI
jgi:hypothetical protein